MVVGQVAESRDLVVVGGGPGGYSAALRGAQLGRKVTLVDRDGQDGVGGVCLRVGCIPSKALIEVAEAAHRAGTWSDAGIDADAVTVDLPRFQKWKDERIAKLTGGVQGLLRQAGVDVVQGDFRLTRQDQGVIRLSEDAPPMFFEFRDVILATGSRPVQIPGLPVDGEKVLDSADVLALDHLPQAVVVVGGGYIGIELGTALAKIGARVVIVEALDRLLPAMDPLFARVVNRRLTELGVDVRVGTRVQRFAEGTVELDDGGKTVPVHADAVVVAVGRAPNTEDLGLEQVGLRPVEGGLLAVAADRRLTPHVAAIGDITPGPALAHKATAEAEVAASALCGERAAFDPAAIPAAVFGDPELATVGHTASEAEAAGMDVGVGRFPLAASGRAATIAGDAEGLYQLVIDRSVDAVVGAQIISPHASELIGEAALAIEMAASPEDLAATIHPHPTFSEMLPEAAGVALGRPLHVSATG